MNRRDLIRTAVTGAAASTVSAQQHAHIAPVAPAAAAAWKPLLFDAHQAATVTALTDLIIPRTDTPGAKDARVVEFIDLLLNDGPAGPRGRFIEGLGWLDGFSFGRHGRPFVQCAAAQQTAMLEAMESGGGRGSAFFRQVKALTVDGYYTSKAGIDELNKGGRVPSGFGCTHREGH